MEKMPIREGDRERKNIIVVEEIELITP